MNWSNKWPDKPECPISDSWYEAKVEAKVDPVEAAKLAGKEAAKDAIMYGIGYLKDGKHIPAEEVHIIPKEVFHFQDGNKRRSIDVTIVGDLALDYDDDGWNIYHVPTGTVFTKAVPGVEMIHSSTGVKFTDYSYEPSELLAWMKKVQEKHDVSWTMLRLLTPDNYNDKGDSAKRIIKEWCLSVPVKE